jgi:dTDP-glucose 4,6-dehydratase
MRLLVTGGYGFLGSHFVRRWLRDSADSSVINVDCLTYAGSIENLEEAAQNPHYSHARIDIADRAAVDRIWEEPFDLVVHFAAETHVDRSLEDAGRFVRTNVLGTQTLLSSMLHNCAKDMTPPPVIVISSDEVYGPTPPGHSCGTAERLNPTSPYAASKASADLIALAYARSYGLDVTILRSVNVYGPRQYPEKLIPLFVVRALAGQTLPLYGNGLQRRCWLYVDDFVNGVLRLINNPEKRRKYPVWHLGSEFEFENRAIAELLCELCGVDRSRITPVPDRPGHDLRYALDYKQTTAALGWAPAVAPSDGLRATVEWIKMNQDWCHRRLGWTPAFLREH